MPPLVRDRVAPGDELLVKIIQVAERAGREERVPEVLDLPLNLALFIGARWRTRSDDGVRRR